MDQDTLSLIGAITGPLGFVISLFAYFRERLVALVGMKYRVDPHARTDRELETAAFFFTGTAALFYVLAFMVSGTYVYLGGTSPAPRWLFNVFDGCTVVSVVDGVIGLFLFTLIGLIALLRRLRRRKARDPRPADDGSPLAPAR
jgi:hypothetical protein